MPSLGKLYDRYVDILVARLRRKIESQTRSRQHSSSPCQAPGYKFAVQPQSAKDSETLPAIDSGFMSASAPVQGIAARRSEPERRLVTVLSCVLVGMTGLGVNLDPEDLVRISRVSKQFPPPSSRIGPELLSIPWAMKFSRCLDTPQATRTMLNARCMQASMSWQR